MPPNGIFSSARPPIQRSMASRPVVVTPVWRRLAQAPVLLQEVEAVGRRAGAAEHDGSVAAARLSASVVAPVMAACVP